MNHRHIRRFLVATLVGSVAASAWIAASAAGRSDVQAQCKGGEYTLIQGAVAGWVRVSPDRTVEWWAYLDGVYEWGDQIHTSSNPWTLQAYHSGSGAWASYAAWKADVLGRSAAQGRTVVFQQHSVAEESVEN